jgi:hypothetical protein
VGRKHKVEEQEPVPRKRKRVPEMRDFIVSDEEVSGVRRRTQPSGA